MVVVKFLVFVSEVVSIFSKILTWIIGGAKGYLCPTNSIIGGRVPRLPPKSTLVLPNYCLTKKTLPDSRPITWTDIHQKAFDALKDEIR